MIQARRRKSPSHRKSQPHQLSLRASGRRGGARQGAGRPKTGQAGVSHDKRPVLSKRIPVHVTLKTADGVYNLRSRRCFGVLEHAFRRAKPCSDFRIVHYGVQRDHVHLICEADDERVLARRIQGLGIRTAKGLNRVMGRKRGRVFGDRYHAAQLTTPRRIRNTLRYVLQQERQHTARRGEPEYGRSYIDPYSSGAFFDGWMAPLKKPPWTALTDPESPTSPPESWLLRAGWKKRGLLELNEVSAHACRAKRLPSRK